MAAGADEPEPSLARELIEFFGALALVALLLGACVTAPFAVAVLLSPWVGAPVALASFWVWGRFGPPPMPGFLSGLVCLYGHAAILGALIGCIASIVR